MDSLTGRILITFVSIEPLSKMFKCLLLLPLQTFCHVGKPCNKHFLFSNSKIQKYSPTESAKVYDKAVNRKSTIHFHPRQTIDFISNNMAHATLTDDVKKRIVKQYLDVSNEAIAYFIANVVHCTAYKLMYVLMYHFQPPHQLLISAFKYNIISIKLWNMRLRATCCIKLSDYDNNFVLICLKSRAAWYKCSG